MSRLVNLSWWKTGCAFLVLLAPLAAVSQPPSQSFATLVNFNGTNGQEPYLMSLIQDTDGNLYGTTEFGGAGYGTIFKMTEAGSLTTVHSFNYSIDGGYPQAGLVLGSDGNFYGTTTYGGDKDLGTVFKITPAGVFSVLRNFLCYPTDGGRPFAALTQATDGNLYGTTSQGGTYNLGTVFKISHAGKLTMLHSFDTTDGNTPGGKLIQATDGNFYGTTVFGGENYGTVFKITKGGTLTTLHNFGYRDGAYPYASLIQAADGDFYGTTGSGGSEGDGTVFKITSGGKMTTLYNFCSVAGCLDGGKPQSPLVQATDGNFYGTTLVPSGTIFEITPAGVETPLLNFDGADGSNPYGGLLQGTSGSFYGTTATGGANSKGTIFSLDISTLAGCVEAQPTYGKVGATVEVVGSGFNSSSTVTFNGTKATLVVFISSTELQTTVPISATTGPIEVTTSSGTLSSCSLFQVIP